MPRHGVLFVRDPVVALDLAEILSSRLEPIQLYFPTTVSEAVALMNDAVCVVTDSTAYRDLSAITAGIAVPHLFLGSEDETPLTEAFARIDLPFTNNSVNSALTALGLIT